MKALNLDALATVKQTVTLHGVEHAVKDMSVQDFVAASQEAKRLEKLGDAVDMETNIKASIDHIKRVLPTIPAEQLQALSLQQLGVLVKFVNGTLEEEGSKAEPTPGGAEGNGQTV